MPGSQFQFQPIVSVPLPGGSAVSASTSLCSYVNALFQVAITAAIILAVIMIVIDGFKYMTSEAVGNKKDALGGIRSALGGLVLILASYLVLNIINPGIVSFNDLLFTNFGSSGASCGSNFLGGVGSGTIQIQPQTLTLPPVNSTPTDLINTVPSINSSDSSSGSTGCFTYGAGTYCNMTQTQCNSYINPSGQASGPTCTPQ